MRFGIGFIAPLGRSLVLQVHVHRRREHVAQLRGGQDHEEREERDDVDAPQPAVRDRRACGPTSRRRARRAGTRRTTTSRSSGSPSAAMRTPSVKKPVTPMTRNVPRITASSGLRLDADAVRALHVAAGDRPDDADEEHDARELGAGRVRLVGLAVQELEAVGELVVDLEDDRGDEQRDEAEVDAASA